MSEKERNELLLLLFRTVLDADHYSTRYQLYTIGEGVVQEYLDMDYAETRNRITSLRAVNRT